MSGSQTVDGAAPAVAPSPRRPFGGLTFRGPEDDLTDTSAAEPTRTTETSTAGETTEQLDDQLDGSPSASEWRDVESAGADESGPTSSRSGRSDRTPPLAAAAQRAAARQAVLVATSMAHRIAVKSEAQLMVGLYLADEDDAERIGDPLARIASRRVKADGLVNVNPDAADAISAMLGLAGYVSKQIVKLTEARQLEGGAAAAPQATDV